MSRGRSSSGSRGSSSSGSRGRSSSGFRSSSRSSRTVVVVGGNRYYGSSHSGGRASKVSSGVILVILGIIFLWLGIWMANSKSEYVSTQGTAVSNTYMGGWNYTTYNYTVDGISYTSQSMEGWEEPEILGKIVTIYYKRSNPNIITDLEPENYSNGEDDNSVGIIFSVIGSVCLIGGIILIAIGVKEKKEQEQQTEVTSTGTQTTINTNTTKCPYCGTTHDKNAHSCPNCGASLK